MENLTAWEICVVVVGALLALASAINLVGSAAEKIGKAVQIAKAPNIAQDKRLDDLEHHVQEIDKFLDQDKRRLDTLDDGNRVTQRALLALLSHGIDGNNIEQMEKARAALEEHLINR